MTVEVLHRRDQIARLPDDLRAAYETIDGEGMDMQPGELGYKEGSPEGSVHDYEAMFDRLRHRGHIEYADDGLGYYRAKDPGDVVGVVIRK